MNMERSSQSTMWKNSSAVREFLGQPTTSSFLAGGAAGAVSRTIVSPLERMKILWQVQSPGNRAYQGTWATLVQMYREEGWRGFMRGNGTNCIRIIPYSAVQFSSYTIYKKFLVSSPDSELDTLRKLTAGALAGITSVALTYPLDITRTRLSIHSASLASNAARSGEKLPGMWTTMRNIYKYEGKFYGLYRGIWPTVLGVAPYVGLNFAVSLIVEMSHWLDFCYLTIWICDVEIFYFVILIVYRYMRLCELLLLLKEK